MQGFGNQSTKIPTRLMDGQRKRKPSIFETLGDPTDRSGPHLICPHRISSTSTPLCRPSPINGVYFGHSKVVYHRTPSGINNVTKRITIDRSDLVHTSVTIHRPPAWQHNTVRYLLQYRLQQQYGQKYTLGN